MSDVTWLKATTAAILTLQLTACSGEGPAPAPDAAVDDGARFDVAAGEAGADLTPGADGPAGPPPVELLRSSITADELALIVNEDDPQSVAVAAHYRTRRKIPAPT